MPSAEKLAVMLTARRHRRAVDMVDFEKFVTEFVKKECICGTPMRLGEEEAIQIIINAFKAVYLSVELAVVEYSHFAAVPPQDTRAHFEGLAAQFSKALQWSVCCCRLPAEVNVAKMLQDAFQAEIKVYYERARIMRQCLMNLRMHTLTLEEQEELIKTAAPALYAPFREREAAARSLCATPRTESAPTPTPTPATTLATTLVTTPATALATTLATTPATALAPTPPPATIAKENQSMTTINPEHLAQSLFAGNNQASLPPLPKLPLPPAPTKQQQRKPTMGKPASYATAGKKRHAKQRENAADDSMNAPLEKNKRRALSAVDTNRAKDRQERVDLGALSKCPSPSSMPELQTD